MYCLFVCLFTIYGLSLHRDPMTLQSCFICKREIVDCHDHQTLHSDSTKPVLATIIILPLFLWWQVHELLVTNPSNTV